MTRKDEIIAAFDDAWKAAPNWESLGGVLVGISEEEASFQHPVYSDAVQEPRHPPSGTILWHLVHLAHCYLWYKAVIEQRPNMPADVDVPSGASLDEAIENLKQLRAELRKTIANVPENELEDPLYDERPVVALARSTVRHDAWHASQIAVAKRLYRMRERH